MTWRFFRVRMRPNNTAINILNDKAIRAAIKAAVKLREQATVSDGGGLSLQVQASGAGWWRLRYWIGGRENRLSLGTYPEVSLADARQRRTKARALVTRVARTEHHFAPRCEESRRCCVNW